MSSSDAHASNSGSSHGLFQRHRGFVYALVALGAVLGAMALILYFKLMRAEPPPSFASDEDHFKYASIGTEDKAGFPEYIWRVLPRVFPLYLPGPAGPGGYESIGLVYEKGHDLPIGIPQRTIGFPRLGVNCALCHTGVLREKEGGEQKIFVTGPARQFNPMAYQRFLFDCASDRRFDADHLLPEIEKIHPLSFLDQLVYRYLIIPSTKKAVLKQMAAFAWIDSYIPSEGGWRPRWGRGRVEPFNPPKFGFLKLPIDETIGVADIPPVWHMTPTRPGIAYHWDGLTTDLTESCHNSALGDGSTPDSLNVPYIGRMQDFIVKQKPPAYPYDLDRALADKGRKVYESAGCADCHDDAGKHFRNVIPVDEPHLGTDRHRVDMWTAEARDRYNGYAKGKPWNFTHFQKTNGYVAVPLYGLWFTAPYLHNGSVPTLWHLLNPSERPVVFYRGSDVYDKKNVGFEWELPSDPREAAHYRDSFEYDTRQLGNGNQGHTWGAELSVDDKKALIEYLKTL